MCRRLCWVLAYGREGGSMREDAAILEYRAERADDLFRRYVAALHVAQTSYDADDWLAAGSMWQRFASAAAGAGISVQAYNNPYGEA